MSESGSQSNFDDIGIICVGDSYINAQKYMDMFGSDILSVTHVSR